MVPYPNLRDEWCFVCIVTSFFLVSVKDTAAFHSKFISPSSYLSQAKYTKFPRLSCSYDSQVLNSTHKTKLRDLKTFYFPDVCSCPFRMYKSTAAWVLLDRQEPITIVYSPAYRDWFKNEQLIQFKKEWPPGVGATKDMLSLSFKVWYENGKNLQPFYFHNGMSRALRNIRRSLNLQAT